MKSTSSGMLSWVVMLAMLLLSGCNSQPANKPQADKAPPAATADAEPISSDAPPAEMTGPDKKSAAAKTDEIPAPEPADTAPAAVTTDAAPSLNADAPRTKPAAAKADSATATDFPAVSAAPEAEGAAILLKTPLIPREVLFGNPDKAAARISPDGKRISYLAPVDGVLNVWVGPADDLDAAKPVTHDTYRGIRSYFWAFTSQHILYVQDTGGDEDFHVYAVDLDGGDVKDLTPLKKVRAEIEGVSEKFPDELLVGLNDRDPQYHDIYRVNIASGERKLVQENPEYRRLRHRRRFPRPVRLEDDARRRRAILRTQRRRRLEGVHESRPGRLAHHQHRRLRQDRRSALHDRQPRIATPAR